MCLGMPWLAGRATLPRSRNAFSDASARREPRPPGIEVVTVVGTRRQVSQPPGGRRSRGAATRFPTLQLGGSPPAQETHVVLDANLKAARPLLGR